jgi:hypothetical protein
LSPPELQTSTLSATLTLLKNKVSAESTWVFIGVEVVMYCELYFTLHAMYMTSEFLFLILMIPPFLPQYDSLDNNAEYTGLTLATVLEQELAMVESFKELFKVIVM